MDSTTPMARAPPTAGGAADESKVVGIVTQEPVAAAERKSKMKVMVVVDDSEGSLYALRWTLDHLVQRSSPALVADVADEEEVEMITLVHVQRPFPHYGFPTEGILKQCDQLLRTSRKMPQLDCEAPRRREKAIRVRLVCR